MADPNCKCSRCTGERTDNEIARLKAEVEMYRKASEAHFASLMKACDERDALEAKLKKLKNP